MITLLIIILMVFLIFVFSITPKCNHLAQEIMESQEILAELTYLIQQKENELNELPNNNSINHFTQSENRVLDLYEQSNIRIPLDILEDLSTLSFQSEKEIFEFIENQRNYWKLENQKKPYKKPTN